MAIRVGDDDPDPVRQSVLHCRPLNPPMKASDHPQNTRALEVGSIRAPIGHWSPGPGRTAAGSDFCTGQAQDCDPVSFFASRCRFATRRGFCEATRSGSRTPGQDHLRLLPPRRLHRPSRGPAGAVRRQCHVEFPNTSRNQSAICVPLELVSHLFAILSSNLPPGTGCRLLSHSTAAACDALTICFRQR